MKDSTRRAQALTSLLQAFFTTQGFAQALVTGWFLAYPGTVLPGRVMSHVARVPAFQLRYPVTQLIGVKAGDFAHRIVLHGTADGAAC